MPASFCVSRVLRHFLLLFLFSVTSCAYRYKGLEGIQNNQSRGSIGATSQTVITLPKHFDTEKYKDFVTKQFPINPDADWIIQNVHYEIVPPLFYCGNGYILPAVVSVATLGIIPIFITDEFKGSISLENRKTKEIKNLKFHAKKVSSFSVWDRFRIDRDPEWLKEQNHLSDHYLQSYIRSKLAEAE